jgi:DNA mismatch endonuclease (patch repair protein)
MKNVKLRDGPLEILVRKALWAQGYRYRCHVRTLPGRPDIVFPRERIAIFVDGDFWHGWRLPSWEHKLSPFWRDKLRTNRQRDARNFRKLRQLGWTVIRLWQHEIKKDLASCVNKVRFALRKRSALP